MSLSPEEIKRLHETANSMLPSAKAFARRFGNTDPIIVEDLMFDAVDNVTDLQGKSLDEIENLEGYLYVVYRRVFINWYKKKLKEQPIESAEAIPASFEDIEKKILLAEIVRRMKDPEKFIYNCLKFGWSYNEIAEKYSKAFRQEILPNALRSKFSKAIHKIADEIAEG